MEENANFDTLPGFSYEYGKEIESKRRVEEKFRKIAKRYGANEILTPIVHSKSMYTVDNIKEEEFICLDVSDYRENSFEDFQMYDEHEAFLKPEETAGIANFFVKKWRKGDWDRNEEKRFYYTSRFFRNGGSADSGGRREFSLAGFEALGEKRPEADAEVMSLTSLLIGEELDQKYLVRVADSRLFDALKEKIEEESELGHIEILQIFELNHKISACKLKDSDSSEPKQELKSLLNNSDLDGQIKETAKNLHKYRSLKKIEEGLEFIQDEKIRSAIERLEKIKEALEALNLNHRIDLGALKGISYYYSSTVFQTDILNQDKVRCGVAIGGRYDDQVSKYEEELEVPAIGFAVSTASLSDFSPGREEGGKIVIKSEDRIAAQKKALELRRSGHDVYINPGEKLEESENTEVVEPE